MDETPKSRQKPGPKPGCGEKGKKYNFRIDKDLEAFFDSHDNISKYVNELVRRDYNFHNPVHRGPGRPRKTPKN